MLGKLGKRFFGGNKEAARQDQISEKKQESFHNAEESFEKEYGYIPSREERRSDYSKLFAWDIKKNRWSISFHERAREIDFTIPVPLGGLETI